MFAQVDPDDFKSTNASKMDESLLVKFFYKDREDKAKTLEQGRPCFKEVEYVEIRIAGQRDAQACRPATYKDKTRFPRHYEAFKKRVELPEEGTLLKEWPQMTRSQAEELSYLNIKTVEQLIAASDVHLSKFHGGVNLKQRANEWLKETDATKLIAEKEALENKVADLAQQLQDLEAKLEEKPKPVTRKRRTTKAK